MEEVYSIVNKRIEELYSMLDTRITTINERTKSHTLQIKELVRAFSNVVNKMDELLGGKE